MFVVRSVPVHFTAVAVAPLYLPNMGSSLGKLYDSLARATPDALAGRVDLLFPSYRAVSVGSLNGQQERRKIVQDIAAATPFDRVIETGTFRGNSSAFFAETFNAPVTTVEVNKRFYTYSKLRLRHASHVEVALGDSRSLLKKLASRPGASGETVFFYLDAHWGDEVPLREELQIITMAWPRAVVMIDDFQVPGDSGYAFYDGGPDKRLVIEYLPAEALAGWAQFFPAAPSSVETGAKCGSCVLANADLAPVLEGISSLRRTVLPS